VVQLARTFGIITTCMGRLEHLKLSLPKMVSQGCNEVIVVDFSCPQGTGEFVATHFPAVRLVSVAGEKHFSNWKARNAGASAAGSDVLVFVDADTILADGAVDWLAKHLPPRTYGFFDRKTSNAFNRAGPRLAANQLKGFHVIPAAAFRRVGGYDEVLAGYAAGGDTDLEERLGMIQLVRYPLDSVVIESVIHHDAASRTERHAYPISISYGAGLLYRAAKQAVLRMRRQAQLPLTTRQHLYDAARTAARALGSQADRASMNVILAEEPVLMPRQLGFERGVQTVSLRVEVLLQDKLTEIPE
jgi:glycosyltransferase involved in cell wall biosynthesis